MEANKVKVKALQCPKCGDYIYSRAHHDRHFCSCGACSIDGGFSYVHYSHKNKLEPKFYVVTLPTTKRELYQDWNHSEDKFGVIPKDQIKYYLTRELLDLEEEL